MVAMLFAVLCRFDGFVTEPAELAQVHSCAVFVSAGHHFARTSLSIGPMAFGINWLGLWRLFLSLYQVEKVRHDSLYMSRCS